jgi:hypothetical protein
MSSRSKAYGSRNFVPAAYFGPKPGDFPVGSLRSRVAARAILVARADERHKEEETILADLTPDERAWIQASIEDTDNPSVRLLMIQLFRVALERAKVYEQPLNLGTPEEIRHRRAVVNEIERMTGGKALSLQISDKEEWRRLEAIARENLRAKKK